MIPFENVCDAFGLSGDEIGEVSVRCPFHDDSSASASVNLVKGKFHCHACGASYSTTQALSDALMNNEETTEPAAPPPVPMLSGQVDLESYAMDYLARRGFPDPDSIPGVTFEVEDDPNSPLGGYLIIRSTRYGDGEDKFVGRNLLDNANPRYHNSLGSKSLFFLGTYDTEARFVWLVEGIFDALSLNSVGIDNVAACLGSSVKPELLYTIRHQTVFILFDNDWAGYSGARKVAKQLSDMGGNPIIVDLSREMGNDPNDALVNDRAAFSEWIETQTLSDDNDTKYVEGFLGNNRPLQLVPTNLPLLDSYLGGGLKDGVIAVGAQPGVGKTSFATWLTAIAVTMHRKRVLYVTYEISKRQVWSRLAAIASQSSWDVLELEPARILEDEKEWVRRLSSSILVGVGWNVNKIAHVVDNYDVVIVDYLQRMPGKPGEDGEERINVSRNIRELSNLARDKGKIVIAISSLSRVGYGKPTMQIFKESGDIEYAVQVAVAMLKHAGDDVGDGIIALHILKNTRGREGVVYLRSDLGHQRFEEAEPYGGGYDEPPR